MLEQLFSNVISNNLYQSLWMIKFNDLKGFQGYHTLLLHITMLSEVGERSNGDEINAMCWDVHPGPALGHAPCLWRHVWVWGRKISRTPCSSTALWNGADSDPKGKLRLGKMTITGANKKSHLWQIRGRTPSSRETLKARIKSIAHHSLNLDHQLVDLTLSAPCSLPQCSFNICELPPLQLHA